MSDSTPRSEPEYEKLVLNLVLCDSVSVHEIDLEPTDFYDDRHSAIFRAMRDNEAEGLEASEVQPILDRLRNEGVDDCGICLHEIITAIGIPSSLPHYVGKIRESAKSRKLADALETAQIMLRRGERPDDIIAAFGERSQEVQSNKTFRVDSKDLFNEIMQHIDRGEQATPIVPTGFSSIDTKFSGGLRPGELIYAAARPGVGKSAFLLNIVRNIANDHGHALLFSMEMNRIEIAERLLALLSDVPLHLIRQPWLLGRADQTRLFDAGIYLGELRLTIDDNPDQTPSSIEATIRHCQHRHKTAFVAIDYIGLISPDRHSKARGLYEATTEISKGLKRIAARCKVPIMAACQLSRKAEDDKNKRPKLSHLRDSGSLEQDANAVVLLHREDMESSKGVAEIDVAKNRGGKVGVTRFDWNGNHVRFSEVEGAEQRRELDAFGDEVASEPKRAEAWITDGSDDDGVGFAV